MNTTTITDELVDHKQHKPGAQLAAIRLQKGYTADYVAGKLHLRVRLIELLETDDYHNMPEPVFIKGYLRAYAKLLGVPAEPLLEIFNGLYTVDKKIEKALWQSRRETNHAEHAIRWLTGGFAIIVLAAVAMWWYTNKDNERLFPTSISRSDAEPSKSETEIRLTDLSKMRSLLSPQTQSSPEAQRSVEQTVTEQPVTTETTPTVTEKEGD